MDPNYNFFLSAHCLLLYLSVFLTLEPLFPYVLAQAVPQSCEVERYDEKIEIYHGIYHSSSANASIKMQKLSNLIFQFHCSEAKVISKYLIKKLSLFTLGSNRVTKLDSALKAPNDHFFHSPEFLLIYPSIFQKLDFNIF